MKTAPLRTTEIVQALRVMLRAARAEKGFIDGRLSLETDAPDTIRYEERWQADGDFEDQLRSPRYARLLALMESALEHPGLEFHFVSQTRGLEYVAAVRGEG